MKTDQEQQSIIQPDHHRIPVRKPLSMVQYWVDTGSLPYAENCHNNCSSSGSSLSEDEIPQSTGISSMHLLANSSKQISENIMKSDVETSRGILSKLTSNLTNSSVDTVAYILANNNTTKKADTKAILKGSKICNESAHDALHSNQFNCDEHNVSNDLHNEYTTTLCDPGKIKTKAETEKCNGYVMKGEKIMKQFLPKRLTNLPITSNSDESIFNSKLSLTPVNGRKLLYKTTDSAVEFTPVSDIDEPHYVRSKKPFESCQHPALETPKVHLKSSFFHNRQKRQSRVKLYHQANANRSLDSKCDESENSSDDFQNQKSQQYESKANYLTVCDKIREYISTQSIANSNKPKVKKTISIQATIHHSIEEPVEKNQHLIKHQNLTESDKLNDVTQPSLMRSIYPFMEKENQHIDLESSVKNEKKLKLPCETKSKFQFTLIDSSEESESTPAKKEKISNSFGYKKSANLSSKQKNTLEKKIMNRLNPLSIKSSTQKREDESRARENNNFNSELFYSKKCSELKLLHTSSTDEDDCLNMEKKVHIHNKTRMNKKRNTQTLDNVESEISPEKKSNNFSPYKLSANIEKINISKSRENIKKDSSTDSTQPRLREIPIDDASTEEDSISSQPMSTKIFNSKKQHENAKDHNKLEQTEECGKGTVKSRAVEGNRSDLKKSDKNSTIISSDSSDEEIPSSQISKKSKIKNLFLPKILSFLGEMQESKIVKSKKKNSQRYSSNESSIHEKALKTIDKIESSQSCDTSFSSCSSHVKASVSRKKLNVRKLIQNKISPKYSTQLELFTSSSTDEDNSSIQNEITHGIEENVTNRVKVNAKKNVKTFSKTTNGVTSRYLTSRKKDVDSSSDRLEPSFNSFQSLNHKKRLNDKNDFSSSDEDIVALARKYKKIPKLKKK